MLNQDLIQQKMPMIMGILNLASGSFSKEGRCTSVDEAVCHAEKMIAEGADIIDIGAEPTNPQQTTDMIDSSAELSKLLPVIDAIKSRWNTPISVDTSDPEVMRTVVEHGAEMINDVRALTRPGALDTVASLNVAVCLMHQCGYGEEQDITQSVMTYLSQRIQAALDAGVKPEHIIIDPGLGGGSFGKKPYQNFELLHAIPQIATLGYPMLIGLSRKSFIGEALNAPEHERVHASLVLNCFAAKQGAAIIRTHDVRALSDGLTIQRVLEETNHE